VTVHILDRGRHAAIGLAAADEPLTADVVAQRQGAPTSNMTAPF
jgi:hypothetical protein